MLTLNKDPSRRDLLVFTWTLPVFFGLLGVLRWRAGAPDTARVLWAVGLAAFAMALVVPALRRWIYLVWTYATFPIAWTVSHLVLATIYFLVATPIRVLLAVTGRDPMKRRFDKKAASYWIVRRPNRDDARYFRQF
jgi:Saxitoxin biosynthesis operon protein SxtJ